MKLKHILSFSALFIVISANAQTETDSIPREDSGPDISFPPPPPPVLEEPYYDDMGTTVEAVPAYAEYTTFNKFKYSKKTRIEEKPDKKASYSMGSRAMLQEISDGLNVPYGYGSENTYVIVQFVVGKDSVLYNPEVLYTRGPQYSINATDIIEKLQYQFSPATKNGKPVDSVITIPVHFIRRDNTTDYNSY
jgi:hypothetical protein